MATIPAGGSAYGDISSAPGRRSKLESFDTSVGSKALTLAANQPINVTKAAVAAAVIADRAVAPRATGLVTSQEYGGQVLTLSILSGGTGQTASTALAATGGYGTGLTVTTTVDTGVVDSVVVVAAGRGYVVGDVVTRAGATFTVTSVG